MSRTSNLRRPLAALLMAAALAAVVLASPAWAATYTVTSKADSGRGSLRQAIIDANTSTSVADKINFNLGSSATITLTSSLPTITDGAGLTIDGGIANITMSGDNQHRVFLVDNGAKLTLSNLTVADGAAVEGGGGIYNYGTLEVSNCTLFGNSASEAGAASDIFNSGDGTAILKNTIVANSTSASGGSCYGSITNGGYNLDSGTSCGFPTQDSSKDPLLGPLADNGGPTKTHALLEGSPAIDRGNSFGESTDQRGLPRPSDFVGIPNASGGYGSDIGAFELQLREPDATPPKVVSTIPKANSTEPAPTANLRATFSEEMDSNTINAETFKLFKKGSTTQIPAQVSYSASTRTAKLDPPNNLSRGVTYKAVVTTGAKDLADNRLDQNAKTTGLQQKVWYFTVDD